MVAGRGQSSNFWVGWSVWWLVGSPFNLEYGFRASAVVANCPFIDGNDFSSWLGFANDVPKELAVLLVVYLYYVAKLPFLSSLSPFLLTYSFNN